MAKLIAVGDVDPIDTTALIAEWKREMDGTMVQASGDFAKATSTWEHKPKPNFHKAKRKGQRLVSEVVYNRNPSKRNPLPWVEHGTKVRYATMTPNFMAKSAPRVLKAKSGAGGVAYVNKSKPRPGIKKREFGETSADRLRPRYEGRMEKIAKRWSQKWRQQ